MGRRKMTPEEKELARIQREKNAPQGVCRNCKRPFPITRRDRAFCSNNCGSVWGNRQRKLEEQGVVLPERQCQQCDRTYVPMRRKQKYCSSPCSNKANSLRRTAEKGPILPRKCEHCQTEFTPAVRQQIYCCHTCCQKAQDRKAGDRHRSKDGADAPADHPLRWMYDEGIFAPGPDSTDERRTPLANVPLNDLFFDHENRFVLGHGHIEASMDILALLVRPQALYAETLTSRPHPDDDERSIHEHPHPSHPDD